MKIAYVAPTPLVWSISSSGTMLMTPANLILDSWQHLDAIGYLSKAKEFNDITINNGLMELGRPLSISRVFAAAEMVDATELVLPDVYKDKDKTIVAIETALNSLERRGLEFGSVKLMAVPQGHNTYTWHKCYDTIYEEFVLSGRVQTIGIPKYINRYPTLARIAAVCPERIKRTDWHLLGVRGGNNPRYNLCSLCEITTDFPWVRSINTSLPIYTFLGRESRGKDWDTVGVSSGHVTALEVVKLSEWCKDFTERLDTPRLFYSCGIPELKGDGLCKLRRAE